MDEPEISLPPSIAPKLNGGKKQPSRANSAASARPTEAGSSSISSGKSPRRPTGSRPRKSNANQSSSALPPRIAPAQKATSQRQPAAIPPSTHRAYPTRTRSTNPAKAPTSAPARAAKSVTPQPVAKDQLKLESPQPTRRRRRHPIRNTILAVLAFLLVATGVRVYSLWNEIDSKLNRVDALSGAASTSGETWLIAGSDSRTDSGIDDGLDSARTDSILLLHKAANGQTSLVSLPRDTYVQIPGYGYNKINASYSFGGAALLVKTVEGLSGLTVDHYVEVGMGGVSSLVNAVGGIEVCLDYDVNDPDSGLVWDTAKGDCQTVDGEQALAYSRMRKSDPTGDIGRAARQRAVINAVVSKAASRSTLTSFSTQNKLVDAGTAALTVDNSSHTSDLAAMLLAFQSASKDGLSGTPPIASVDYQPGGIGEAVLLQDTTAPDFFTKLRDGKLAKSDFS